MRGELIRRLRRLLEKNGKEEKIRGNLSPFFLINLRNLRIIDGLNLWFNSESVATPIQYLQALQEPNLADFGKF